MNTHPQTIAIIVLAALFSLCGAACAQNPPASTSPSAEAPAEDAAQTTGEASGDDCTWGCLRWGKMCNVDPRGVYKCRRSCERFGEICE